MKKTLLATSLVWALLVGTTFASNTGTMVGGDRDEHGCIPSAWYVWSVSTNACIRPWENQETIAQDTMVTRAHNAGITKYSTWNSFMPDATVTREQAAKMIVMWMNGNSNIGVQMNNNTCMFNDEKQIDSSLTDWVRMACQYGLFQGYKGNFMPTNKISTNDIATVVERLSAQSPVVLKYTSMIKIKVADRPLRRGELLKWLHTLDIYVKEEAAKEQSAQLEMAQTKANNAKMLWAEKNIITYTLTQKASCFCAPEYTRPIKYSVISNSVSADWAVYTDGSGGAVTGTMVPKLHTVDQAFAMIQDAIDNKAESVTVEYDAVLWYPTSISIDRSRMIADEEQYFTFSLMK
jgi:Family of unknown function (DUF6174)